MNPEEITARQAAIGALYKDIEFSGKEVPAFIREIFVDHHNRLAVAKQALEKQRKEQPKVRLSKWGIEMQRPSNKNKTGIILRKSLAGMTDYSVEVLWDGAKKGIWMHESQVQSVKKKL